MLDMAVAAVPERALLYDYAPWEQMSKQRRGIMWALMTAQGLGRTLVVPPLRFHTAREGVYEYRDYSALHDIGPLGALHAAVDQRDYLATTGGRVDLVFGLLRGVPSDWAKRLSKALLCVLT